MPLLAVGDEFSVNLVWSEAYSPKLVEDKFSEGQPPSEGSAAVIHLHGRLGHLLGDPQVVLLGGLTDALPGDSSCAEGGYKGAILAAQNGNVGVRLVQVVVEFRKHSLLHRAPLITVCSLHRL